MPLSGWFEGEQQGLQNNMDMQKLALLKQSTDATTALQQAEAQSRMTMAKKEQFDLQNEMALQQQMMQLAVSQQKGQGGGQAPQGGQPGQGQPRPQGQPQNAPQPNAFQGQQGGGQQPSPDQAMSALDQTVAQLGQAQQVAFNLGMPDKASKYATATAGILEKKQQIATSAANQQLKQIDAQIKMAEQADAMVAGVKNENDWNTMKMVFANQMKGQKNPFDGVAYSPQLVAQIREGTKAGLEKLKSEREDRNEKSMEAERASANSFREFRKGYMAESLDLREKRAAEKAKTGGKEVSYPSNEAIEVAKARLQKLYPNLPEDEAEHFAFDVASKAKAMTSRNKGLDPGTALTRAIEDPENKQNVQTVDNAYFRVFGHGVGGDKESHYRPGKQQQSGKVTDKVLPMPASQKEAVDGAVYSVGGKPMKWNAKTAHFEPTEVAAVPAGAVEEDDEDE